MPNPTTPPQPTFQPRQADPRAWFQTGFFAALGVITLLLLTMIARRLGEAMLAVAAPFVLGGTLALLLDPLADRLERRGWKRLPAAGVVFLGLLLLFGGIGYFVVPMLVSQASDLASNGPKYVQSITDTVNNFLKAHPKIGPFALPKTVAGLTAALSQRSAALVQTASGRVAGYLVGSITLLVQFILALVIAFFLLVDIDRLRARLFYLMPERWRGLMGQLGGDVGGVFSDYLRGLLIVCALYGVATIGLLYGLSLIHHPLAKYALLVGALAGILYAVPYVGSATTALITFIVAFAAGSAGHHNGLGFAGLAVGLTLVLNQVFDNIVTPRVVGGGVGLHPVVAIFALVMGGELFGLWGMLLSVPIAGSIQIILFRFFPKFTAPTPTAFLRVQGVPRDQQESSKILQGDDSITTQNQQSEKDTPAETPAVVHD